MNNIRGFALGHRAIFSRVNSARNVARLLSVKGGATPEEQKAFYALGVNVAMQVGGELKKILTTDELQHVIAGFSASLSGQIADERELLAANGKKVNEIISQRMNAALHGEKKKGSDYITSYLLKNPKAQQLPSGLIYHEIISGIGAQPNANSTVKVHYHGTLIDGTVFDSSVERGEPIEFALKQVIPGWQEGVAKMRIGGKSVLVVPSNLAYGDNGSPPVIPPGATLQFEVELIHTK